MNSTLESPGVRVRVACDETVGPLRGGGLPRGRSLASDGMPPGRGGPGVRSRVSDGFSGASQVPRRVVAGCKSCRPSSRDSSSAPGTPRASLGITSMQASCRPIESRLSLKLWARCFSFPALAAHRTLSRRGVTEEWATTGHYFLLALMPGVSGSSVAPRTVCTTRGRCTNAPRAQPTAEAMPRDSSESTSCSSARFRVSGRATCRMPGHERCPPG